MASDQPRRSWRPDAAVLEPVDVGPGWRREQVVEAAPTVSPRRRRRIVVLGLLFLMCVGALAWLAFWLALPRPAVLVLIGAGYEDNLAVAPNVYGRESMTALADLANKPAESFIRQAGLFRLKGEPTILRRDSTGWAEGLGTFSEKTIVIYFALHGGSDPRGPYLLPDNADWTDSERNRLRLAEVLTRLKEFPAEKKKLLVFDATQVPANWGLGILQNDFARGLQDLEPKILDVPNLVVLSASDLDQRSWGSDDWQRTAFGHYLVEGLRGGADDDQSSRIDAWKLYRYVRDNVERWARANRNAVQIPVLLPAGAEGEKRARSMYLTMVQEPYKTPDAAKLPVFTPPPELAQAWDDYRDLSARLPPPAAYAPHLWRQFQAVLLRYENLVMAGDLGNAARMLKRLGDLKEDILAAQQLPLSSVMNTLAMPAAAGLMSEPSPKLVEIVNELWKADPGSEGKKLKKLQDTVEPAAQPLLPLRLTELIYERAAADTRVNLERAVELLREVRTPSQAQPAEVHFLRMLRRDLAAAPPLPNEYADAVQLALQVRRQAERAALGLDDAADRTAPALPEARYPYSEQVAPWNRATLEAADAKRRLAEDLLFASGEAAWREARALLGEDPTGDHAFGLYTRAQKTARALRTSLAVRDKLLAGLPGYAAWLGRRDPNRSDAQLLKQLEQLADQAHTLALTVEPGRDDPGKPEIVDFAALGKQAAEMDKEFGALHEQWKESWREALAKTTVASWRDATDALAVADPTLRVQLVTNIRRISRELLVRSAGGSPAREEEAKPANPATAEQTTPAGLTRQAQASAIRQGRMALAVLGKRWFDDRRHLEVSRRERSEVVTHRLSILEGESRWWEPLAQAGEQIASRFRDLPDEVRYRLELADKPETPRAEVIRALRGADRLTRLTPGAIRLTRDPLAAATVPQENPPATCRRWLVQDLLLVQAQRTLDDRWAAEDPTAAEPFYQVVGSRYVKDADLLVPRQRVTDAMQTQLKLIERFKLEGPRAVLATSEARFGGTYRLRPQPNTYMPRAPGRVVFWLKTGEALQAETPAAGARLVEPLSREQATPEIRVELSSPALKKAEQQPPAAAQPEVARVTMRGLFRGEYIDSQIDVHLYPLPDVTVAGPPLPATGGIVVRAPKDLHRFGAGMGAVAIVLDCSGSMGEVPGTPFSEKTKYNQVTRALEEMLGRLPKGTQLSLWMFGQAVGGRKTAEKAEDTILQVRKPAAWDRSQLKELMDAIRYPAKEPWNESPIMRTILRAKEDLVNAPGFKTIVVLTDGMDNRFDKDAEVNPDRKTVPAMLQEAFQDSGIVIHIVGFRIPGKEIQTAHKQFREIEDLSPPGKFYTVNDAADLAGTLQRATRQRLAYWVDRQDNAPVAGVPAAGLDVTMQGANDQWLPGGLEPGGYKLRLNTPQALGKGVVIDPGDQLLVQLGNRIVGGEGVPQVELRRGIYSRDDFPGRHALLKNGWRMAVLQNQRLGDTQLQMLLTLEKLPVAGEAILQLVKPRQTWVEVVPDVKNPSRPVVRWLYQPGYPAPAWTVDSRAWPTADDGKGPAPPVLRVWWSPDLEATAAAVLSRGPNLPDLFKLRNHPVTVEGAPVRLDGLSVEEHFVETAPGERTLQKCLVVRMTHDLGPTVWARPAGLRFEGQEHRFYHDAKQYTGLFWPVNEASIGQALQSVGVISLTAFKRDAELRGYYLEDRLPPPAANDVRPRPVGGK